LKATQSGARERQALRARIRVALWLALDYESKRAFNALTEIRPEISLHDREIAALYFHAHAVACTKARRIAEGFEAFETSIGAARAHGDLALCAQILNNYGTAATEVGSIDVAVARLEEALAIRREAGSSVSLGIVSLAEALLEAGELERAAHLLHEFHSVGAAQTATMQSEDPTMLLSIAAVGIPLAVMLGDEQLLASSSDSELVEIAFSRREQYLVGPLVEAFCFLYEQLEDRSAHDALLSRALESMTTLDNSLQLAIRAARLGSNHQLARISTLVARQCSNDLALARARKDLFDSFIAGRRRMDVQAKELASRAARCFAAEKRPLHEAVALAAGGDHEAVATLYWRCGARVAPGLRWTGPVIPKRMAKQLTPRESEIAHLAAKGSSNRAIASVLGLSERTVQNHCEAIFIKLGIRSRWQISAELRRASDSRLDP
jgi:DNA-binding CsgD family transcriptional regulator/tetratricopeptide (TPR) repeat protein